MIVVGVDASSDAGAALRWAGREALLRGTSLLVLHVFLRPLVYAGTAADMEQYEPERHRHAQELLRRALADAADALTDVRVDTRAHPGNAAAHGLIEAAADADLLVLGRRGADGFEGLLLGSTAEHCARHAPCPVVVVPSQPPPGTGRIVVGVDGSKTARRALHWALDETRRRDGSLEIVSVYLPYRAHGPFGAEFMDVASPGWEQRLRRGAAQVAEAAAAEARQAGNTTVTQEVAGGHPAQVLIERASEADLLVVGSRGLGGFAGMLLGSVSRQVLHHAPCPMVVVRPPTGEVAMGSRRPIWCRTTGPGTHRVELEPTPRGATRTSRTASEPKVPWSRGPSTVTTGAAMGRVMRQQQPRHQHGRAPARPGHRHLRGLHPCGSRMHRCRRVTGGHVARPTLEHRQRRCVLRDGSQVLVRPICPDDKARLLTAFEALSPRSRYQRFLTSVDRLSDQQLRFLTEIDYHDHMAWVALAIDEPGEPGAGVARYVRLPEEPNVAEAAVTIADRFQGRGLGTLLLGMLASTALDNGIEVFRNYVLASNEAMIAVFENLGATAQREDDDVVRIDMALSADVDDLPDTPAGRVFREVAARTRQPMGLDLPLTLFRRLAGLPDVTLPAAQPRGGESSMLAAHLDAVAGDEDVGQAQRRR